MDTLNCMKALISLLGVILAVAFMASPAHAQSHENDRYQKLADDLKTPGLAVVTFDATGVTDEHYVGVDSNSNPIGPDSLFIWGSISKSFTSALAMMLAEQGKIDLNAPLTRYYPEFQGTALGNNGATVTDLIHHTAGLPRELNPYPRNLQSVIDGVKDLPSVDPVGTHSYSNISYILLQQLIERATGESYSTLLETYLDPATGAMASGWLNLDGTWFRLDASGAMRTGWLKEGSSWYYLQPSGAMATGWVKDGAYWYYLDEGGVMVTGDRVIDGVAYTFDSSGRMR